MTQLTKQRKVLMFVQFDLGSKEVYFGQQDEDTEKVDLVYRMSTEDWEDMGAPDTLTVTVEPGDLLNEIGSE